MNDRERAFLRRLSEPGYTVNQYRMLCGMLAGMNPRDVGLPDSSLLRTRTELRKLGLIDKIDGVWRLTGDVAGLFDGSAIAEKPAPALSPASPPPAVKSPPPTVEKPQPQAGFRHPFLNRNGREILTIVTLMELSGTDKATVQRITDCATTGAEAPADLIAALDRAETLAARRFPA